MISIDNWEILSYLVFLFYHKKSLIWFRIYVSLVSFSKFSIGNMIFSYFLNFFCYCWGIQDILFSVLNSWTYIYLNFICQNWTRMGEILSENKMPAIPPQEVFWFYFDQRQDSLCCSQVWPPNPIFWGNEPTTTEVICYSHLAGLECKKNTKKL